MKTPLKKIGDKITILANEVLGTDACEATIIEVYPEDGVYVVHCDGDPEGDFGPISLEGEIVFF